MVSAYAVTSCPAAGTETPKSAATSGRIPAMTYSVVPMAKTQIMSATSAAGMSSPQ